MTIAADIGRSATSACNGATRTFPVPFQFVSDGDLQVYLLDDADDPNQAGVLLARDTDYTIAGSGALLTASITTTIAYPAGKYVRRWRETYRGQSTDYVPNSPFPAASTEVALDRLTCVDEEIADDERSALRLPEGERTVALAIPADRLGTVVGFDNATGRLALYTSVSLAALIAADLSNLLPAIVKGDPGANVMAVGLFVAMPTINVPLGTNVVRTSGFLADGVGIADYVDDGTVDAAFVAANPRTSFITANGRGFRLTRLTVDATAFGAAFDGVTDDTAALAAGMAWLHAKGGGVLQYADGTTVVTGKLTHYPNIIVRGRGRFVTKIKSAHAGGGGANPGEDLANGSCFVSAAAINASTPVFIGIEDLCLENTNAANVGAGYYDTAGTYIHLRNVRVVGFKYAAVLDQSELAHIDLCGFESQNAGGAGVWIVNGPDLTPGVASGFTNVISIKRTQINQGAATYGIIDDGGDTHTLADVNFNGCLNYVRAAGVGSLTLRNCRGESSAEHGIVLDNTKLSGAGVGGGFVSIDGGLFSAPVGYSTVHGQGAGPGQLALGGNVNLYGGGGTAPVTGTALFFRVWLGLVANLSTSAAICDGKAANHNDTMNITGAGQTTPSTVPGTGFVATPGFTVSTSNGVDGNVSTLEIGHGAAGGQVYLQSLLHAADAFSQFVIRTRHADGMGERGRFNETGLLLPAGGKVFIGGTAVLGAQQGAIADDASGAANQATLNQVLAALRAHGIIDT